MLDTNEFNRLITEKKFDEAKELLRSFFETEMDQNDEGEYYVEMMTEYLEMSNRINAAYIEEMTTMRQQLKQLNEVDVEIKNKVDTGQIRRDIDKL